MMYHRIGLLKGLAPDIDKKENYIILPCYYERDSHWCFILVDINHQGGEHKVYMVDSARVFHRRHR